MIGMRNTSSSYGLVTIAIHWLMALAIFAMFGLGLWMRTLGYYDSWYHHAPELHKSIGILLLFLLVFRFIWRMINTRPELLGEAWEKLMALMVHRMHYLLLFAVMLTGYLIPTAEGVGIDVFAWFTVPALFSFTEGVTDAVGLAHRYLAWAAILLAVAHAAAALKHHVLDKDMTLRRILGVCPKTKEEKENIL